MDPAGAPAAILSASRSPAARACSSIANPNRSPGIRRSSSVSPRIWRNTAVRAALVELARGMKVAGARWIG